MGTGGRASLSPGPKAAFIVWAAGNDDRNRVSLTIFSAQGATKRYKSVTAISDVSFELKKGLVYGLLGPNGSGKTTCLHLMTGLIRADGGNLVVGGIPIDDSDSRRQFGFAPDDLALPGALTGREYLALHDGLRGRNDEERAFGLLVAFDIYGAVDRQIEEYSHGMRRKIQIVAATMHFPALLILDEPLRGLDPESVAVLRHAIKSLAATGRTVLIATHDIARAQTDCDQVMILDKGSIVAEGAPQELVAEYGAGLDLEAAFFALTGRAESAREKNKMIDDTFHISER